MAASLGTAVHASIEDLLQVDLSGRKSDEIRWLPDMAEKFLKKRWEEEKEVFFATPRRPMWKEKEWDKAKRMQRGAIKMLLELVGANGVTPLKTTIGIWRSILSRVIAVEGELRTHGKPQFGTSKHLAEMLLEARNIDSSKCAIINIRPPGDYEGTDIDAVQEACNQLGWSLADADRNGLEHTESEVDVILDIGDFGWEPSLYVLGQSPLEVVDRCHTLVKTLEGMS